MDKILTFQGRDEKGIHVHVIDSEKQYLEKTASAKFHPTIEEYIKNAKKIPGKTQILLTALGASEFWGDNVNSDAFPESQLAHEGEDYGYRTFLTMAKLYKHHVNKDPNNSYGDVLLSVYNPVYHRVELIVTVDHVSGKDIIDKMDAGIYPSFSMGCKIPYDVCSICGNKAPNRKHYCEHLRYQLGQIHPETNRKVFAINIKPKFFDISYVLIPADKTAFMLKKVASSTQRATISSAYVAEKKASYKDAAIKKLSEMEKEVPLSPPGSTDLVRDEKARDLVRSAIELKDREELMPAYVLDDLTERATLPQILSSMSACMITPKPQEFQRMLLMSEGYKEEADKLWRANACFDPTSYEYRGHDGLGEAIGMTPESVSGDVLESLYPFFASRSYAAPLLVKRLTIAIKIANAAQPRPTYFPVREHNNPSSSSLTKTLAIGALIYAAVMARNTKAFDLVSKMVTDHPYLSAGILGAGAGAVYSASREGPRTFKGRFSGEDALKFDNTDVYDRIKRMGERPYINAGVKLGSVPGGNAAALRRLLIGVPAVHLAAGALQRRADANPYQEEGKITSFIRNHPNLLSGALVADALLARHGKGSTILTGKLNQMQHSWLNKRAMQEAAGIEEYREDPSLDVKSASVQDYVSGGILWPAVMGVGNLPGRIVGGVLDQAALDLGSELVAKRNKKRDLPPSNQA
jgi:hypothetical protein